MRNDLDNPLIGESIYSFTSKLTLNIVNVPYLGGKLWVHVLVPQWWPLIPSRGQSIYMSSCMYSPLISSRTKNFHSTNNKKLIEQFFISTLVQRNIRSFIIPWYSSRIYSIIVVYHNQLFHIQAFMWINCRRSESLITWIYNKCRLYLP